MYTIFLATTALSLVLVLVMLNRRLHSAVNSNKIYADRITWGFVGVVAACAALGVVLQLLSRAWPG